MVELLWNASVSESKMSDVFDALGLRATQSVLDIGCGNGEVLIRLHEQFRIKGAGIDVSADHVQEASRRAEGRVENDAVRFTQADARSLEIEPDSVDLAMCLGATHALGPNACAYQTALARLQKWVVPGGLLLVAEGYLQRPASPEYRELIGNGLPDDRTHAANVAIGRGLGLVPLGAWTSSVDEWDHFEWMYQRVLERRAVKSPECQETGAKIGRRRAWMDAYLRWGRETLGYGTYLFQRPTREIIPE